MSKTMKGGGGLFGALRAAAVAGLQNYKRVPRRGRRRGAVRARPSKNRRTVTYLPSTRYQRPLPECYHTRFLIENDGWMDSSTASPYITIGGNNIYQPFNTNMTSTTYVLPNAAITATTQQPVGAQYLLDDGINGSPYAQYRVMSTFLDITSRVTNSLDVVEITIIPLNDPFAITSLNAATAAEQPWARKMIVTPYKAGRLKLRIDWAKYLGVSKQSYKDDLSGNYVAQWDASHFPNKQFFFVVYMQSKTGGALQGKVTFNIKAFYNTCCFNDVVGKYPM